LLGQLEALRIATRRTHGARGVSRNRSAHTGGGIDFADHRSYAPGDDLRRVDWTLYGRLEQLMVRVFQEESDLIVHLLVDVSRSMALTIGEPSTDPKSDLAQRLATAVAYVALAQLDRVVVWPFTTRLGTPLRTRRRKAEAMRVWQHLASADLPPGTDIEEVTRRFLRSRPERGLVVVFSDFPDDTYRALGSILQARHDLAFVHLLTPGELNLPLPSDKDLELVDGETGEVLYGVRPDDVLRMRTELRQHGSGLAGWCRRMEVPLVQTVTGNPTDLSTLLLQHFRRHRILR
jgi:uncharacterized protein (DUF58 family)